MLNPRNIGPGEEQYEFYVSKITKKYYCQYDYRDANGNLFSCVRPTLEECRKARNIWLNKRLI